MENELALGFNLDDSAVDQSINKLKEYDRLINKVSASSSRVGQSIGRTSGQAVGGGSGLGQIASYSMMNTMQNIGRRNESQFKLINDPVSGVQATTRQMNKMSSNVARSVSKNNSILQSQVRGFARVQAGNIGRRMAGGNLAGNLVAKTMQRGLANRVGSVIGSVLGSKVPVVGTIIGAFVGAAMGDGIDKIITGTGDWWKRNIRGFTQEQIESHRIFNEALSGSTSEMQAQFAETSNAILREFRFSSAERRREILEERAGGNILPGRLNRFTRRFTRLVSPISRPFIDSPEQATEMAMRRQMRMESAARRELAQREQGMSSEGFRSIQDQYAAAAIRRMLRP